MKKITIFLSLSLSFSSLAASQQLYCNLAKKFIPGGSPKHVVFETDLNNDKKMDFFISEGELTVFGADFKVFMTASGSISYAGNVYLHPNAVQFIPGKDPKKEKSILAVIRDEGENGELVTYEFSGNEYKNVNTEKITSKNVGAKITRAKINTSNIECK